MSDYEDNLEHSKEIMDTAAKTAADVVQKASEIAQNVVDSATVTAEKVAKIQEQGDRRITNALSNALREVFNENIDSSRFIDVSKIPLICQSIVSIHENLKGINVKIDDRLVSKELLAEILKPIQKIVYGLVGTILTAVIVAVLGLIIKGH